MARRRGKAVEAKPGATTTITSGPTQPEKEAKPEADNQPTDTKLTNGWAAFGKNTIPDVAPKSEAEKKETTPKNAWTKTVDSKSPKTAKKGAKNPKKESDEITKEVTDFVDKVSQLTKIPPKIIDPTSADLSIDDIEEHIINNLSPTAKSEAKEMAKSLSYKSESEFVNSVKEFYKNYNFDEDDLAVLKILWQNDGIQKNYSKLLAEEITELQKEVEDKKLNITKKNMILEENRKRKGDSAFELPVKYVRTRTVICHDMSILHLRFCALCRVDLPSYEEAVDHLYDTRHVNNLENCFEKGSQPKMTMKVIQCNVCNTKPYEAPDLNSALFDHISSYSHAVNGISPPKKVSKQLELTAKANLCAYYVNKEIPTNLAQQAAGHVIGHASSSIFMSSGNRMLTKNDLRYHPLRISGNLADAEDNAYKSAAFSTFCMTQGMTSDQVKKMWNWQPLFLPVLHIRGKCGLCKNPAENSLDLEKSVANLAKNVHLRSDEHKTYCAQEWIDIDKRLGIDMPVDVKCFLIAYCDLCKETFSSWNTILSHTMNVKHRRKVDDRITPWERLEEAIVID